MLIGIREISNDLPIDELTLLLGNEILNDEKKYTISFASSKIHSFIDHCLIRCFDVLIVYRRRLTSKAYFYLFYFLFCLQQYAIMDNSSLIQYDNTQSELKVLTFGEIMYY